jgi:predicted short-subunit dehydrogenase-like oxidoreductase (DUF2520 family)
LEYQPLSDVESAGPSRFAAGRAGGRDSELAQQPDRKTGETPNTRSLAIIGAGKVGTAIAIRARAAGYEIAAVASLHAESARAAAARIGGDVRTCTVEEAAGSAGLVLLTTPDGVIESLCRGISEADGFRPNSVVAHCSGLLTSEVLRSASERCNCRVASFHPLQSFPSLDAALTHLPGSFGFIEGDPDAANVVRALGEAIGMRCVAIDPAAKVLYHAAAVVACNYLSSLLEVALQLDERAAIPREEAWLALEPMVRATLDNVARLGPRDALSGPIARGDAETVALHLDALSAQAPEFESIYRALGRVALGMVDARGELDSTSIDRLRALLDTPKRQS